MGSQRRVILPINVEPTRNLHDRGGTIPLAFVAIRLIFGRVPGIRDFAPLCVERGNDVIAFIRDYHPVAPVLGYNRFPITRQILWSRHPWRSGWRGLWIGWASSASPFVAEPTPKHERQCCREHKDSAHTQR